MPTNYRHPPQHRRYRNNILRKGALETALLWESEDMPDITDKQPPPVSSPVSVQDVFSLPPEMKPLILPGAWNVVGKKGKPLKGAMYLEPDLPEKKKKKKKKRKRKTKVEVAAEPLADLEEEASTSKSLHMSDLAQAKASKEVSRARAAKYWARYQDRKEAQKVALAAWRAIMAVEEHARTREGTASEGPLERRVAKMHAQMVASALDKMAAQDKAHRKSSKSGSLKEKTRRTNRFASAEARCYDLEDRSEEYAELVVEPTARQEDVKEAGSRRSTRRSWTVDADGFWSLEMKPRSATIASRAKQSTDKRKMPKVGNTSPEAGKANSKAAKKGGKQQGNKCSIC